MSAEASNGDAGALRVLVVDDHPVVRSGLVALIDAQPDLLVVAEAGSGAEAVVQARTHLPDVVLMDLRMPGGDGVRATSEIARTQPGTRVLVLTTYDTDSDILRAVEAGATGYLLKDVTAERLVDAVRAAARGETVLAAPVAARLLKRLRMPDPSQLTPRELDVLKGAARGLSNTDIGRDLHIGGATVKSHLLRVFAKLGVESRTAAVTVAMERGILPPPGG
ncbi:MAG: response regulator transcription factor [Nocardioidaceae bacterium]